MRAALRRFWAWPTLRQLCSFAAVGLVGLVVDAGALQTALWAGMDAYSGRGLSYVLAATVTWALNRHVTFKSGGRGGALRQWAKFVFANLSGFIANYGTYALCVAFIPLCREWPVLALVPASVVGLVFNFVASKKLVFNQ